MRFTRKPLCMVALLTLQVLSMPVAADETASAREMGQQFSRYDQLIDRLMRQNEQLMGEVRQLQRENLLMKKTSEEGQNRVQVLGDEFQKIENMTVNNLASGQKQLAQRVTVLEQNGAWGQQTRDCADLKVKHQQIKVQVSPDGAKSVKFLCYDGKVLHLGTEVHDPAGQ